MTNLTDLARFENCAIRYKYPDVPRNQIRTKTWPELKKQTFLGPQESPYGKYYNSLNLLNYSIKNDKLTFDSHTLCNENWDSFDSWRYLDDIERCRRLSELRALLSHCSMIKLFLDQNGSNLSLSSSRIHFSIFFWSNRIKMDHTRVLLRQEFMIPLFILFFKCLFFLIVEAYYNHTSLFYLFFNNSNFKSWLLKWTSCRSEALGFVWSMQPTRISTRSCCL